jgi:hypothetical protein
MPNLQAPIQELIWEERERLGVVPAPWGPYCALLLSRRGGWVVLKKTGWLPAPEVVELGK